jgi:hypothetical protein
MSISFCRQALESITGGGPIFKRPLLKIQIERTAILRGEDALILGERHPSNGHKDAAQEK